MVQQAEWSGFKTLSREMETTVFLVSHKPGMFRSPLSLHSIACMRLYIIILLLINRETEMKNEVRFHHHFNGLILFAASLAAYISLDYSWGFFFILILAPDLFMLGYLVGPRIGARIYNIGHSLLGPAALLGAGFYVDIPRLMAAGIIWAAHIGIDHVFGYGYKYSDGFKHTHFSEI